MRRDEKWRAETGVRRTVHAMGIVGTRQSSRPLWLRNVNFLLNLSNRWKYKNDLKKANINKMTLKRQTINLCTMATALPPQKLFNFLGGLVENFVTLRKKFHIFHRYCTQTVTTSFSKFHTQSAHLLLFKSTHASWPPLYPPKSVRGMFQQCSRGVPAVFHQCCTSVPGVFQQCSRLYG